MRSKALLGVVFTVLWASSAMAEPMLGAPLGNKEVLLAEGAGHYNAKRYAKAAEVFLKATRADPEMISSYLQLARSYLAAKQVDRACYVYRVYLKSSGVSPDRKKAEAEAEGCNKKLKRQKKKTDFASKFVEDRAKFFSAIDGKEVLGPTGAAALLERLLSGGFVGPELAEMGKKLGIAAKDGATDVFDRALKGDRISPELLYRTHSLLAVAKDVGADLTGHEGNLAFLEGLSALSEKNFVKAQDAFSEAMKAEPNQTEYAVYLAIAKLLTGDVVGGQQLLEQVAPNDPRTYVWRMSKALLQSPDAAATELEKTLFLTRMVTEK